MSMLHIVTVHWLDDRWIEPQLRFIRKNVPDEFRVYASLHGIDPARSSEFFYAEDSEGTHPEKLNRLADVVRGHASPDDLLLFVDGDAFPIAPVTEELLGDYSLAAVRRDENANSPQPHPCFCLTTVGFWFAIEGDWRGGYMWQAANGDMLTDSGGNLLGVLTERAIPWRPLLRSNRWNLDPLLYAIYGDAVYHHGAGFRAPVTYRVTLPSRGGGISYAGDRVWASAYDSRLVVELDPATGALMGAVHTGSEPRDSVVDGGTVWVVDQGSAELTPIALPTR